MTLVTGKCLEFDGIDDYLAMPHHANQLLTTGGTIEAWIKAESFGEVQGKIVDKSTGVTGGNGYSLVVINGGYIRLYMNGSARQSNVSAITFGDGNFYHVVVTWDNTGYTTFYVNGVVSGTPGIIADPAVITTTNALRIGNRSTVTDRTFDGLIDEVRLYNRAPELAEIQYNYNGGDGLCEPYSRTGLILWLPMLEGFGTTTYDKSTTGLTGTISGAAWVEGKIKHTGAVWDFFTWG